MIEHARRTRERWRDGEQFDVAQEMMRLTLGVVAKTLFDAEVEQEADEIGGALTQLLEQFPTLLNPFFDLIRRLPLPQVRRFNRALARLDQTIYRIIEERRRTAGDRGDLLSMLLMAQDDEGDGTGMSDQQLRDEVITLFTAGHETTANALAWTFYLLSQNPEAERELHRELDTVLAGRLPTSADFARLPYTEIVVAESMRLYPPAWGLGRLAITDVKIGDWDVPKGSVVILAQWTTHRDPRFWPDPERFDPLRHTPEAKAARPRYAYFPFGGGPRTCIGEGFAWMEGVLILATLAQQWRLVRDSNGPASTQPLITLRPRNGIAMRAVRRV
jgi:cytochrome P450